MKLLIQCLAVGAAGSIGAILRFCIGKLALRFFGTGFPLGTFIINVTGCLLLGWFMTVQARVGASETLRLAVAVGFIGTYTTFSTFAFESNRLLEDGLGIQAVVNIVASVIVGLIAVRVGIALAGAMRV